MTIDSLSDEEVAITAKAVSIHRGALRRKLDRLSPDDIDERAATIHDIEVIQGLLTKLNKADLLRATA